MSQKQKQRFGGIERLYGTKAFNKFKQTSVVVIGIGGVGSWAAESLARSGIGGLTLIDLDDICITNVNRQIHALSDTIGQSKAYIMAKRIATINPECKVRIVDEFVDTENIAECLGDNIDYVLEAIDAAVVKAAIIAHCKRNKIPIVSIGAAGGKTDPSMIKRKDLNKTWNDPLLAKVRSQLRSFHGFSRNVKRNYGVDCIYSTEQQKYPDGKGGITQTKPVNGAGLDCETGFGSATHITSNFAQFAVARILQRLAAKSV